MKAKTKQLTGMIPKILLSLIFLLCSQMVLAQSKVTGHVADAAGEPVIGASVMIQGTSRGGITDVNGNFTIDQMPANGTLVVSYVGYVTQNVKVGTRTQLRVVLEEDRKTIDEVVVVGYGTITKRSVSTAMSTVKGDKISDMPTSNVAQSLAGLSAGIYLQ